MPSQITPRSTKNAICRVHYRWPRKLVPIGCGFALLASVPLAMAADYAQCGPGFSNPARPIITDPSPIPDAVDIEADSARLSDQERSILSGNVVVRRNTTYITSDEVHYQGEESSEKIDAIGSLRVWHADLYLTGSRGRMVTGEELTIIEDADYQVLGAHAHGSASRIQLSGNDLVKANDASYTTCNPGDEQWMLNAERLRLDKGDDEGIARNAWVTFKGVPIFFSPYLSFPLSDARKSGLLAPSAGVTSSTGIEATIPYYFNIAPNLDATLALRSMTERGFQAQGEFRYLFGWGEGKLASEFMPRDSKTDESRFAVAFKHRSEFSDHWRSDLKFDWVSDSEYFEDLGTDLTVSSRTFLEQRADVIYNTSNLYFRTRVQNYQTIDRTLVATDRPYERLPQLYLRTKFQEKNLRFNANTTAEVTHFDRRNSVTGVRWDVRPYVTFPYRTAAGYIVPKAIVRYTGYSLDGRARGESDDPSRLVPSFSLDSGLFFERPVKIGSRALTQTFEPRAYYLLTAYERQDDLPVFDTGEYTFSFAQLFREDRFTGADRVSDANQLTLAMTTRFLDRSSGSELLRASIGQIQYFRDRKITLPDGVRKTSRGSNIVGEVVANLDERWRVSAGTQINVHDSQVDRNTVAVRYQPDERRVMNVAYRFVRDTDEETVEQTDVSFAWPISRYWRAVGRWNYSLESKSTVGIFSGFEYESCCWGLRVVGRRYLSSANAEYSSGIFVQFVLKGLTSVGNANNFLGRSIPGYRDEF